MRGGGRIALLLQAMLELVAPERCRICRVHLEYSGHKGVCGRCLGDITYLGTRVCRRCGTVMRSQAAASMICGACLRRPPPYDRAVSLVHYSAGIRQLLLRLKYQGDTTVLPALATIAEPALKGMDSSWDLILPVPLYRRRLQLRGMNQALALANMLFPTEREKIVARLLVRSRATRPQTGLDGRERRRNLRGAFALSVAGGVAGCRVLLVDDVFTTGTTVAECSRVLRRAGAARIEVLTLARVVIGKE